MPPCRSSSSTRRLRRSARRRSSRWNASATTDSSQCFTHSPPPGHRRAGHEFNQLEEETTAMNRFFNRRTLLPALLALGTLLSAVPTVQAQTFPSKPIALVLPFPPGGCFDPSSAPWPKRRAGPRSADRADAQAGWRWRDRQWSRDVDRCRRLHADGDGQLGDPPAPADEDRLESADRLHLPGRAFRSVHRNRPSPRMRRGRPSPSCWPMPRRGRARSAGGTSARSASTASSPSGWRSRRGARFNMIPFKGGSEAFQALIGHPIDVYGDPGFGPWRAPARCGLLAPSPSGA